MEVALNKEEKIPYCIYDLGIVEEVDVMEWYYKLWEDETYVSYFYPFTDNLSGEIALGGEFAVCNKKKKNQWMDSRDDELIFINGKNRFYAWIDDKIVEYQANKKIKSWPIPFWDELDRTKSGKEYSTNKVSALYFKSEKIYYVAQYGRLHGSMNYYEPYEDPLWRHLGDELFVCDIKNNKIEKRFRTKAKEKIVYLNDDYVWTIQSGKARVYQ